MVQRWRIKWDMGSYHRLVKVSWVQVGTYLQLNVDKITWTKDQS